MVPMQRDWGLRAGLCQIYWHVSHLCSLLSAKYIQGMLLWIAQVLGASSKHCHLVWASWIIRIQPWEQLTWLLEVPSRGPVCPFGFICIQLDDFFSQLWKTRWFPKHLGYPAKQTQKFPGMLTESRESTAHGQHGCYPDFSSQYGTTLQSSNLSPNVPLTMYAANQTHIQ